MKVNMSVVVSAIKGYLFGKKNDVNDVVVDPEKEKKRLRRNLMARERRKAKKEFAAFLVESRKKEWARLEEIKRREAQEVMDRAFECYKRGYDGNISDVKL